MSLAVRATARMDAQHYDAAIVVVEVANTPVTDAKSPVVRRSLKLADVAMVRLGKLLNRSNDALTFLVLNSTKISPLGRQPLNPPHG